MKLYRDKSELFQCDLEIEGAKISESEARLILKFDNNQNYLFYGKINEYGNCKIDIPALKNPPSNNGKVVLEVIAEGSFLIPWESEFEIENSKKVSVTEVKFSNNQDNKVEPKIKVTNLVEKVEEKIIEKVIIPTNKFSVKIKEASDKSKNMIREALSEYSKLSEENRNILIKKVEKYSPSLTIEKWSNKVFQDVNDKNTKICMFLIEKNLK